MIKDNKDFECVTENNITGISNELIKMAAKTYNPSSVIEIIKQIENICQAQTDYSLYTMERMFRISPKGIEKLIETDLFEDWDKEDDNIKHYLLTINGKQNIKLEQVTVIEEEERLYKIVEYEITRTSTQRVQLVIDEDEEDFDIDNYLNNVELDDNNWNDEWDYDYCSTIRTGTREEIEEEADDYINIDYNYGE